MKQLEKALADFINNEDIDEGNENLRKAVRTLDELRYVVAVARQKYPDEVSEVIDCLVSL